MNDFKIRPACNQDFQTIIELNQAAIKSTGAMDLAHLQQLNIWSDYHKVIIHKDVVMAFLLVLAAGKPYQSLYYRWFGDHYDSFLYVDRIVVGDAFIGMKIGSQLYDDLFAVAQSLGVELITCEYNIKPLNKTSQIFHQRFGFTEVTTQWLDGETKQVSLQVAEVNS